MAKRGRKRRYTAKELREQTDKYFRSISRTRSATEMLPTGEVDRYGHPVLEPKIILNDDGEEIRVTEYVLPPTMAGLCRYLGITHQTWANYCDGDKHPEFVETTTRARERMREWNEEQLLTRAGKDVRGIIFNLQNNYGYSERREVELGDRATKTVATANMSSEEKWAVLQSLMEQADGEDEEADEQ